MPRRIFANGTWNQPPPYGDVDLFASDRTLQDAVATNGGAAETDALMTFGRRWGTAEMFDLGWCANENPPALRSAGDFRSGEIEFHPAYHRLTSESVAA